jgi:cytoskeletal protein RodZ
VTREDFRREIGDTFDSIAGSPSPALGERVRSALVEAPEHRGPVWIAALAAAVIAVILVGVLLVANPLGRLPVTGGNPSPNPSVAPVASPTPSPSPTASPSTTPFTCGAASSFTGQNPPTSAYVDAVRTGAHTGYDRLTIEFKDAQPQTIELRPQAGTSFTRDGIGDTVKLAGKDGLLVSIFSGNANTAYTGSRDIKTGYAGLLEVRIVGDYEGYVHFGLGLAKPACYRAVIMTNPTRLVIDIQTS